MSRVRPAEEVEQQLARGPGDPGDRLPPSCPDSLGGPGPLKFKAHAVQPPGKEPGRLLYQFDPADERPSG